MRGSMRGRKALLAVVTGFVGAVAVAAPALAWTTTEYPSGGTWQYGITNNWNFSNYHHPSARHRSSVSNSLKGTVRSDCENGGIWAYAGEAAATTGNQAFWSIDACS
jgi:lactococcin 972 family bacteriocin